MTDIYVPNYGDPNEFPDVGPDGKPKPGPITFGHNATNTDATNTDPSKTDGTAHEPLKDVNGNTVHHLNPDGSLGDVWYQDESSRPAGWNEGGADPTGSDVADAIEAVGNNPDAIKSWLGGRNFHADHIPPPDFTPNVDDDFDPPPNGLDGLGAVGATKNPTSVVPEVPENFTFDKLRTAFTNVAVETPIDLHFSDLWTQFGNDLVRDTQDFATQFVAVDGWEGETAQAVKNNVLTFTDLTQGPISDLSKGLQALGILEAGFSRMMMWIALDIHNDAMLLDVLLQHYPHHVNDINSQFDSHAQSVIRTVYNPAIKDIAQGNPSFGKAPPISVDPNNPKGAGDGGGDDGGIGDAIKKALNGGGGTGDTKGDGGKGGGDDFDPNAIDKDLKNLFNGGGGRGGGDTFDPNAIANALKNPGGGGGGGDNFDPNALSNALGSLGAGGGGGDGFDPNALSNALTNPNGGTVDPTTLASLLGDPNLANLPPAALQALAANLPPGMTPADLQALTGNNFSALPQGADSGLGALSGLSSGLSNALGAVTGAGNSPAGTGKSLLSNANQNGADGAGQAADVAGKAADAAQQALGALQGKGGDPHGAGGFDPKNLKALDSAGGGGGAGLGARSGAAGLGPAGTPVAAMSKAALPAMATGERALAGSSAGAGGSAGGGSGSGGGGGGQRGATGKEHKANKASRRKKNGEEIFGDIDAVVPVLGADDGEQRTETDETAQQPARTTAAERRHSQPQRDPRLVPNVTPGQTIGGR